MSKIKHISGNLIIASFICLSIWQSMSKPLFSQTIAFQTKKFGLLSGTQATFDVYKPYFSVFTHIKPKSSQLIIDQNNEKKIYSLLLSQMFSPKFILIQSTFYQLSSLSSYLETDHLNYFNRFKIIGEMNLLRSLGGGYEEPYAFTLFLGNVLYLRYNEPGDQMNGKRKQSGSALAGFAVSFGKHQICDNIYFHDFWYQIELVLTGKLNEQKNKKMSWNFRAGTKIHEKDLLLDVLIFSIERNHSIYTATGFSILQNSVFKYVTYLPLSSGQNTPFLVYQQLSYGKKFPVSLLGKKVFLVFGIGIRWEWITRYACELRQSEEKPTGNFLWLIQPNIEL